MTKPGRRTHALVCTLVAAGVLLFPRAAAAVPSDAPWKEAGGYVVKVEGGGMRWANVYQSPDFRSLLVVPGQGDVIYLVNLVGKAAAVLPRTALAMDKDGALPDVKTAPGASSPVTQKGAELSFTLGGVSVVLGVVGPLVGETRLADILRHKPEYAESAHEYTPDPVAVAVLKNRKTPVDITVLFGTWCNVCRRYVPCFMRVVELAANPKIRVRYVAIDSDRAEPKAEIARYQMRTTPTFVVSAGGRELGRIEGHPRVSVERDLVDILSRAR